MTLLRTADLSEAPRQYCGAFHSGSIDHAPCFSMSRNGRLRGGNTVIGLPGLHEPTTRPRGGPPHGAAGYGRDGSDEALEQEAKMTDERLEDHMQRFEQPDGYCFHCGQPANQHHPVGPITITISDPNCDDRTHEFCEWRCFARWAAAEAGGNFVVGRN